MKTDFGRSDGRIRLLAVAGTFLALSLSIVGCVAQSPIALPSTSPSAPPVELENSLDDLWAPVMAQFPQAKRPDDVAPIRFVSPKEMPETQVTCMREQGFDAQMTPDGGVAVTGIPEAQQEPLAIARYVCAVKYQVDPQYTDAFTANELDLLYSYYSEDLMPCLENEGYSVSNAPSRDTFRDNYASEGWSPYADLAVSGQDEWYRINEVCPQWPIGFWG